MVNYAFDPRLPTPAKLLETYHSLTGWCDALARTGASVRLLQAFHHGAESIGSSSAVYTFYNSSPTWLGTPRLHSAILDDPPDIVHVNGLDAPLQTWLLRQTLPRATAIVVQDHGGTPAHAWSVSTSIKRRVMRAADGFLFTAAELADPWRRAGCITDPRTVHAVMEASTNLDARNREEARAATGVGGSPALVWVGRLEAVKDPLTVLDGFEMALQHVPSATLTMIYQEDGLLADVKSRLGASRTLCERVTLRGAVAHDRLADWCSAADMFVLGSAREVCGYAVVEACACGAVPVVTDIPAFRAITADGAIGALWSCGSAPALAGAIVTLSRRNLLDERRRVLEHFERHLSWTAVARRARTVYESVIAQRRSSYH